MRIRVGAVNAVSKVFLCTTVLGFYLIDLGASVGLKGAGEITPKGYFIAFYLMTLLAFCAFPRRRRGDIAKLMVLAAVVAEAARRVEGFNPSLLNVAAAAAGAGAVFLPSFLERFRTLMRSDSRELFSMVYHGDRRRRSGVQAAQPVHAVMQPQTLSRAA